MKMTIIVLNIILLSGCTSLLPKREEYIADPQRGEASYVTAHQNTAFSTNLSCLKNKLKNELHEPIWIYVAEIPNHSANTQELPKDSTPLLLTRIHELSPMIRVTPTFTAAEYAIGGAITSYERLASGHENAMLNAISANEQQEVKSFNSMLRLVKRNNIRDEIREYPAYQTINTISNRYGIFFVLGSTVGDINMSQTIEGAVSYALATNFDYSLAFILNDILVEKTNASAMGCLPKTLMPLKSPHFSHQHPKVSIQQIIKFPNKFQIVLHNASAQTQNIQVRLTYFDSSNQRTEVPTQYHATLLGSETRHYRIPITSASKYLEIGVYQNDVYLDSKRIDLNYSH